MQITWMNVSAQPAIRDVLAPLVVLKRANASTVYGAVNDIAEPLGMDGIRAICASQVCMMWCEMSDAVKYAKRCIITKNHADTI